MIPGLGKQTQADSRDSLVSRHTNGKVWIKVSDPASKDKIKSNWERCFDLTSMHTLMYTHMYTHTHTCTYIHKKNLSFNYTYYLNLGR